MKEDKIFLKFYNDTNLYGVKPLNEIAPEKIIVTPTKLSSASETYGVKQFGQSPHKLCKLISLNGL